MVVGAHDFIAASGEGYDTQVEERGLNFSLGQRQLIALARALVADPRIVILDEATATVDSRTEMLVQEALKVVLEGRTSLIIAHRLSHGPRRRPDTGDGPGTHRRAGDPR